VEELGFRAILLRITARVFGPVPGLLISAVLFALAHAGYMSAFRAALLFINGGLLLGVLYLLSGSLWVSIGAHLVYYFTEWSFMGVGDTDGYLVLTPSLRYPAWLTGGTIGPDGSIVSAIIAMTLISLALFVARIRSERSMLKSVRLA